MFTNEIFRLQKQGFTTGAIAIRLGLVPSYVRSVLSAELTGCDAKPLYGAVAHAQELYNAAVFSESRERRAVPPTKSSERRAVRGSKAKAERKRAEALKRLAEAEAELARWGNSV